MDSARSLNEVQIFNNASQAWNNDFFLRTLVRIHFYVKEHTKIYPQDIAGRRQLAT